MNKYAKYIITVVTVGALGTLFYNKVYIPKTTYKVVSPNVGDLSVKIRGIGNVSAEDIYSITAQTGGKILALYTDEGEWVKKGSLLIEMDGVDLPEQLEVMQATLKKSEYDISALQDELLNQESQKKLLKITYNRYAKLKKQKFASDAEYDKAKTDLDSINASISATKSRIGSAKAASNIAAKNVDVIKAKLARLKVYAPIDGYIISKSAEVAQSVLPATPIFRLVDASTLWVEAKVDERVSKEIKVGQSVTIGLRSQPSKTYAGVVKRVKAMSDAVTLEREIDVAFVKTPKPFYINEQAEVKIAIKKLNSVVKIPLNLIVQEAGEMGVWVAKNEHAQFVKLEEVGHSDDAVAVKNFDKASKILVPNPKKKPLSNGMKIHL